MSELLIVRKQFTFEREFSMHKNWWVRDERIAGYPLTILLYLLSHSPEHPVTQTEAQAELGIGKSAWRAARAKLLQAGFLIEVRDRWPAGARDSNGRPLGGQKRFRLVLQDPEPDIYVELEDALIEADHPIDWEVATQATADNPQWARKTPGQSQCRKSAVAGSPSDENRHWIEKPLVRASAENRHWTDLPVDNSSASADNRQSFKGREYGWDGINKLLNPIPSVSTSEIDEAELNRQLQLLHPSLTVDALQLELRGRVKVEDIDLLRAARSILAGATTTVNNPPAYVARSIMKAPWLYRKGAEPFEPIVPAAPTQPSKCDLGQHNWGPTYWPEDQRGDCLWCHKDRREVDPVWVEQLNNEIEEADTWVE